MNSSQTPDPEPLNASDERRLQQLFHDGAPDYIADAGFTASVLGHLPVARRQREWRRRLLVGAALVLGCALTGLFGGADLAKALAAAWSWLGELSIRPLYGLEAVFSFGSAAALLVALGVGWWFYSREA